MVDFNHLQGKRIPPFFQMEQPARYYFYDILRLQECNQRNFLFVRVFLLVGRLSYSFMTCGSKSRRKQTGEWP